MTIRVKCPSCRQTLKAEERHAGRTVRCPACKEPVKIPEATSPSETGESIDPFAEFAAEKPAPAAPVVPPSESKPKPKKKATAPTAAAAPASPPVDDDEIGDWLTEGEVGTPLRDKDVSRELTPQSPNWNGVAETYDLVGNTSSAESTFDALPPKVGKKKKKKKVSSDPDLDEATPTRSRARTAGPASGRPWLLWVLLACLAPLAIGVVAPDRPIHERLDLNHE